MANKQIILFIFLLISMSLGFGQQTNKYLAIDTKIMQMPKANSYSVNDIANYVKATFKTDEEKARAVFFWVGQWLTYDVANMRNFKFYDSDQAVVDEAFRSRKGVCGHYAALFREICNKAGVKTHMVEGYTSQNGKLDDLSHAWNVSFINGKWQIIDPTWGTGYLKNGKFVRELNNSFFLIKPEECIKTHCPFDPTWQLLTNPVSYNNFDKNDFTVNKQRIWNYNDSIIALEKADSITKILLLSQRISVNGTPNKLVQTEIDHLSSTLNKYYKNSSIDLLNSAIRFLNISVNNLNEFVQFYNKQFTPTKKDMVIKYMIISAESPLDSCKVQLNKIKYADPTIRYQVTEVQKKIAELDKSISEYKLFIEKYIATPKIFRKTLFVKPLF